MDRSSAKLLKVQEPKLETQNRALMALYKNTFTMEILLAGFLL